MIRPSPTSNGKASIAKINPPPNFMPFHPFNNGELVVRDEQLAPWPRTPDIVREHLLDYYSCISCLDHQIGRSCLR